TQKILVTGSHGFIGSYLIKNLLNKRRVPAKNLFLPTHRQYDLLERCNCDKVVTGQDIVIHAAARVGGIGYNQKHPAELFYDNLLMGIQLMESARLAGVKKFIAVGTVCAYPKFTPTPFKEKDIWNGYPEETNAPYGLAKKMLLVQAQAYRDQYGFNAIYLLPANTYGPGDDFSDDKSHVLAALIKKVSLAKNSKSPSITAWGTGQATREFLYAADAAEGIIRATELYDSNNPLNLGTGQTVSITKLLKLICKIMNYKGKIVWDKSKPDGQPRRQLDVSRAKKYLKFTARTSLESGLKQTIAWYQKTLDKNVKP
ncbi:MAG: GDP-fucose synthetase, partial [Candidatus Jacksonbacteria bacterium RIFOXYD2_FULL_43_21]